MFNVDNKDNRMTYGASCEKNKLLPNVNYFRKELHGHRSGVVINFDRLPTLFGISTVDFE